MILNALPALGAFINNKRSTQLNTKELRIINKVFEFNKISVRDAIRQLGMVSLIEKSIFFFSNKKISNFLLLFIL